MFPIIAQINLLIGSIGVAASIVISFLVITLIASYYRFQHIVEEAEKVDPEEMGSTANEILRVQLARYLAGCARRNTSFCLSLIHVRQEGFQASMESKLVAEIKIAARRDDVVCLFNTDTLVLIAEAEPEDAENILTRIIGQVSNVCAELAVETTRVGISSYPGHGLSGKELIKVALEGLKQSSDEHPVLLPEIVDIDVEDEEEEPAEESADPEQEEEVSESEPKDVFDQDEDEDEKSGKKSKRKDNILDPLTGVLKPTAISAHMQRMMSDLRYKRKSVSLFCIGVNNMEHIERIHGAEAVDEVLVGVSKILKDNLRSDDLIGRHEKYAFLALVKCSLEESEQIGRRISLLVQQQEFVCNNRRLRTTITLGVAAHPEHGRNLHHLYTAGQKVLDYSRSNDIRAYAVYDPEIHDKVPSKPMRNIKSIQA